MSEPSEVHDNDAEHRFETTIAGSTAFASYEIDNGVITFTHTKVPEALRGRGVAGELAKVALAAARARGLRVTPKCTFFVSYIKGHPQSQDLLTPEGRTLVGLH